jgi:ubiquinone/menaquinone biosynthesis C-methylase UbiE
LTLSGDAPSGAGAGSLSCATGHVFPIAGGIPRFAGDTYAASFGFQWNRFSTTQLDSANGTTESRDTFLEKTGLALEDLRGKRVLDVGCGMGRFLEIVADAGAEVVGIDLSSAVDAARRNLKSRQNVSILQADVFRLPFADESFDLIYSIGVLHHTPDTRVAFLQLPRFLRPGGRISIWVYSARLRAFVLSPVVRQITKRVSAPTLLKLCEIARPWGGFLRKVRSRNLRFLLHMGLNISVHPNPEWRVLDTFDWYSPHFQHMHTRAEVHTWFREGGLTNIRDLAIPVALTGVKP